MLQIMLHEYPLSRGILQYKMPALYHPKISWLKGFTTSTLYRHCSFGCHASCAGGRLTQLLKLLQQGYDCGTATLA